ncbi:F-box only protein 40-like [Girardinichthys multiradiatus]|uniref:F-box only protein 40-like n=1 Tax=Girardinichthys multiradiatus TaxID=208333 RepID=UPI001FAB558C|nr:F-box only protein 40-like [Girardinichthys multiradiatus]XP_047234207.1 F-box only protein 40-like [Girardinichthys multiradiatus]
MSHRSRASRVQQHLHCDSCYSRRCRARVEVSVSCALVPCRLLCGAVFHLCKEEDHLLLCPNVRVPCLNAHYGCPAQMPRSARAAHLQACPASVVCCSMEWLRWPADETNPHSFNALQDNVMKECDMQGEALDVAMALVDQSDLYARLKMKTIYPELMEQEEEEIKEEIKEDIAVGGLGVQDQSPNEGLPVSRMWESNTVEDTAQNVVTQPSQINKEKYNLFEMMFNMDRGACAVAQENLENQKQKPAQQGRSQNLTAQERQDKTRAEQKHIEGDSSAAARSCPPPDTSKTGQAPWQEGVLDRLGQELTPHEYNMYMVHHGRMLLAFGQIDACTPRKRDFVYGSLEPIPVQTLRSFKVPVSYRYKRRVHLDLYEITGRVQTEQRGVDTSDLGASEEDWFSDEAAATLLGYAEIAVMGHKISDTKGADGLYADVGTQTHSFRTAPFKQNTTLVELMVDRPQKLLLQLQAESVNSRNNRASCAFTFLCGHTFHRKEFASHFRNVHSDIQMCLSDWFEQRCPLAYLGCTYRQRRFHPSTQKATVNYNQHLRCFNLRPDVPPSLDNSSSGCRADSSAVQRKSKCQAREGEDWLSSLPYEVLCHVAGFLDSLSLSQLALVSRLMRQVCSSLLQKRGMVTLRWERTNTSRGEAKWKSRPVWEFSHLFSTVDSWEMADIPPISAHLKVCPYYQRTEHRETFPLPFITEKQEKNLKGSSLLNHFTGRK